MGQDQNQNVIRVDIKDLPEVFDTSEVDLMQLLRYIVIKISQASHRHGPFAALHHHCMALTHNAVIKAVDELPNADDEEMFIGAIMSLLTNLIVLSGATYLSADDKDREFHQTNMMAWVDRFMEGNPNKDFLVLIIEAKTPEDLKKIWVDLPRGNEELAE